MGYTPFSMRAHILFWCGALIFFSLCIWVFKPILLPFVLGIAVAYLLNPTVKKLGELGIARAPATMMILGGFLILITAFIGVISPILYRELSSFSDDLPHYIEKISALLAPIRAQLDQYIGHSTQEDIQGMIQKNSGSAVNVAKYILSKTAAGGQALIDLLSVLIFMPIVAYFMMKEWPYITAWVHDLMPRHAQKTIVELLSQIDKKIAGFVRGQISVALFLGIAYAIALSLAGLKYGFLIGLFSGFLSIIPMVGSAVGLFVSVGVAWFQFYDIWFVIIIAAIFIIGQVIEGNILTPKFVGDSVGLHPLWVFFALLAGGSILGILGMFLAVPIAAVIGVLLTFSIEKYKQSAYYADLIEDKNTIKDDKSADDKS